MNKKQSALLLASLCLSCSTAGSFSTGQEKTDSLSLSQNESLSSEISGEESIFSTSEDSLNSFTEGDIFARPYQQKDGQYQSIIARVLKRRAEKAPKEDVKPSVRIFCEGDYQNKEFVPSDFPEIEIASLAQCQVPFGVLLTADLPSDSSQEYILSTAFLLLDNPYVTFAGPRQLANARSILHWIQENYVWPEFDESSFREPKDELSYYEARGIDVNDRDSFPFKEPDIEKGIPGYLSVRMKLSENRGFQDYAPSDFPNIGIDRIFEFKVGANGRRYCVFRLKEPSFEACQDAIFALAKDPSVYDADIYGQDFRTSAWDV